MVTKLEKEGTIRPHSLSPNYDWKDVEPRVRAFTDSSNLRERLRKKFSGRREVGYVEGPPTLNGDPHIGHVRGRLMKDLWYRYSTLSGKKIVFRGGWDTQGLPIELQAEKELGLTGNKWENLKKVGEEKLVEACKRLIKKYESSWVEADNLLGLLIDHERAYKTYRDEYIEREWKYLETAWHGGLLAEGIKVVAYCPSCLTSLSHAEVALGGYEPLDDPSLYYKVKAEDGSYLLIWTTMPFTVVTDELVAVKPDAKYLRVRVGEETWVVGAERKDALEKELGIKFGQVVKEVKGSELEGLRYSHPLLDLIPGLMTLAASGQIHRVVAEDFVDTSTGTGVVHLSPANGEDDYLVATRRKIPIFSPLDDEAHFTEEAGKFRGLFVRDADSLVSSLLKERGPLVYEGRIVHDYPVCWRSGHRLLWVVRREYFYWIDRLKKKILEAAEDVEYFFDSPRNRFLEFLRESPPWGITRERIWGTPLPIWVCSECGEKTPAFSRRRILELATNLPDGRDFELHRPWIDRIVFKCPKCASTMHREPFVLDTWHNSGSAPYSSFTDQEYRRLIPTEFLTEGIDQTRGWAYTLLVLNVILSGKPLSPYRSFLFQGHVLDAEGRKMSKSIGNVVDGLQALREYSVDLLRLYLLWKSSPIDPLSLDVKEMSGRPYQVLNTLYHIHVYLTQNGPLDGYVPRRHTLAWARRSRRLSRVDRWILSVLAGVEKEVHAGYREGRYNEACKAIEQFVIETLSQNYVRMTRGELWDDSAETRERRLAIFATLGHVLERVDLLLHPVSPYLTEYLHQEVFAGKGSWKIPLLVNGYGRAEPLRREKKLEETVAAAILVENGCNSARVKAKLKRRWPLRAMYVLAAKRTAEELSSTKALVSTLCNVKVVRVTTRPEEFPVTFMLVPNPARVGAAFKEKTRDVLQTLKTLRGADAWRTYLAGSGVKLRIPSGPVEVPLSAFDLKFDKDENFEAVEKEGVFVAIERTRDERLVAEGLERDVARRLQALRKARGFSPTALLKRASVAGLQEDEIALLTPLKKELSFLVRAREIQLSTQKKGRDGRHDDWFEDELDGRPIYLSVS